MRAKRELGSDYGAVMYFYDLYTTSAFAGLGLNQMAVAFDGKSAITWKSAELYLRSFEVRNSEIVLPGITLTPVFQADRFGSGTSYAVPFSMNVEGRSSMEIRAAMIASGGPLAAAAERHEFETLCRRFPNLLNGSICYTDDKFDLQLKFIADDLTAVVVNYSISALIGHAEERYLSWLPITRRVWRNRIVDVAASSRESVTPTEVTSDLLTSIHRLDVRPTDRGVKLPTTIFPTTDLKSIAIDAEGVSINGSGGPAISAALRPLRFLKRVAISDEQGTTPVDLSFLKDHPQLEWLSIHGPITEASLKLVTGMNKLTDLILVTPSQLDGMAQIASLPHLESLFLDAPKVDSAIVESISRNAGITCLGLGERVKLDTGGIASIARMTPLRSLDFYVPSGVDIGPAISNPSLTDLNLMRVRFDQGLVDKILKLSKLESLGFEEARGLTREQLLSFGRLRSLRTFRLRHNPPFPGRDLRRLRSQLDGRWMQN